MLGFITASRKETFKFDTIMSRVVKANQQSIKAKIPVLPSNPPTA